ncbi:MAG: protein translocase subunit SecD [Planctomycetes bacterium]|nr:protein translocase subunit SecD [Planctomycetota bacterium]
MSMSDKLSMRWFVVLCAVALAGWATASNWPLNYGIDLMGGTTLTYSVDPQTVRALVGAGGNQQQAIDETIEVISTRIDTLGVRELTVRQEGGDGIVLQSPNLSREEADEIRRRMVQLGQLEFPVGVGKLNQRKSSFDVPGKTPGSIENYAFNEDEAEKARQAALEAGKTLVAIAKAAGKPIPLAAYRDGMAYEMKNADGRGVGIFWKPWTAGETARRTAGASEAEVRTAMNAAQRGEDYKKELITGAWVYYDPMYYGGGLKGFTGKDIVNPKPGKDEFGKRTVTYGIHNERQGDFEEYTQKYVNQPMALVLNDELWSAPTIQEALRDSVQIRGGGTGFAEEEQGFLVNCLQSGSLKLRLIPGQEETIAATLGTEAVNRGWMSVILGAALVFAFTLVYYRLSGMIAVITLILNIALVVALLALFRATLTLPGIAGIVLTIGMAVDANILVFERIREEQAKGKALLAAVDAGFNRAFITIVDSNLTTVITAALLYRYGVGPIKGFAVTLMAGLVASLFTAVFVAKTVFLTFLRNGSITQLSMMRWVPENLGWKFLSKARICVTASVIAVVLSVVAFVAAGDAKYGLDFTGGYVVRMNLEQPTSTGEVSSALAALKTESGLQKYPQVEPTGLGSSADATGTMFKTLEVRIQTATKASPEDMKARVGGDLAQVFASDFNNLKSATFNEDNGQWDLSFDLKNAMSRQIVEGRLYDFADSRGEHPYQGIAIDGLQFSTDAVGDEVASDWRIQVNEKNLLKHELVGDIVTLFGSRMPQLDGKPNENLAFGKISYVGPNVVANLKKQAIVAVVLSLIAVVLYIWMRFKELRYGIAAAVATFHDAIVALGAVIVVNKLGWVHVPINLPIIAGFLTIMGYSLNDTIVQFDRVRENLGNVKGSLADTIDLSINQTLGRTLLTSLTVFITVLVLFLMNRNQESGIEGIAFTLLVGVVVGTYSTIYVASPIVIWIDGWASKRKQVRHQQSVNAAIAAK